MDDQHNQGEQNMEGGMPPQQEAPPQQDMGGGMPMPEPEAPKKSFGPIIGIIIIVILIILAGFYFWGSSLDNAYEERQNDQVNDLLQEGDASETGTTPDGTSDDGTSADTQAPAGEAEVPVSESDAIEDLEAELDSTVIDELDAELESIDAELNF